MVVFHEVWQELSLVFLGLLSLDMLLAVEVVVFKTELPESTFVFFLAGSGLSGISVLDHRLSGQFLRPQVEGSAMRAFGTEAKYVIATSVTVSTVVHCCHYLHEVSR